LSWLWIDTCAASGRSIVILTVGAMTRAVPVMIVSPRALTPRQSKVTRRLAASLAVAVMVIVTCSPIGTGARNSRSCPECTVPGAGKLVAEQAGNLRAQPHAVRAEVGWAELPVEFAVELGRAEVARNGRKKLHVAQGQGMGDAGAFADVISSKQRFWRVSEVMISSL
jgi:hypothetical protein